MSTIDTSGIDETKPEKSKATTKSVRDNTAAIKEQLGTAQTEITALETGKEDAGTAAAAVTAHEAEADPHGQYALKTSLGTASGLDTGTAAGEVPTNGDLHRITTKTVAGTDVTLTAAEAQARVLVFTGTLTANINVIVPDTPKLWLVANDTMGSFALTVKTSLGTGIAVPQGEEYGLRSDGVDVVKHTGTMAAEDAADYYLKTETYSQAEIDALSGRTIQRAFVSTGALISTTSIIPADDTIPQITEGGEALSLAFTPKRADSRIRVRANLMLQASGANSLNAAAVFRAGVSNALGVTGNLNDQDSSSPGKGVAVVDVDIASPGTSAQTFSVRFGPSAAVTVYLNANSIGTRQYGGAAASILSIEEFMP